MSAAASNASIGASSQAAPSPVPTATPVQKQIQSSVSATVQSTRASDITTSASTITPSPAAVQHPPTPPPQQVPAAVTALGDVKQVVSESMDTIASTLVRYRQALANATSTDERRELIAAMQEAGAALLTLRQLL